MARKVRRRFNFNELPQDVLDKIQKIEFADYDGEYGEGILGIANTKEGWVAIDGGRWMSFTDRKDLIEMVREEVTRVEDFQV